MPVLRTAGPLAIALLLLSGDATSQTSDQAAPPIEGTTVRSGKGNPHGRSDSDEPFFAPRFASEDPSYGRVQERPIRLGTGDPRVGPRRERLFLNGLRGPKGQPGDFERRGSCCFFQTPHGVDGRGLLDVFDLRIEGVDGTVTLYINMYDPGEPMTPQGFTPRAP